ncbi:hypothetical protein HK098_002485 [Nowakowskiella sp. JEL0407]|nr:hypothetical protein HK098_002485 [Nowakowskiella sp. JEL0407]
MLPVSSTSPADNDPNEIKVVDGETPQRKIIFVGDSGVGKTSSILAIRNGRILPEAVIPKTFLNARKLIIVSPGYDVDAFLCDTVGDDYESGVDDDELQRHYKRPSAYEKTHVVVLMFSVAERRSFERVKDKWVPEIRKYLPKAPIVLVGSKIDLRNDTETLEKLKRVKDKPVSTDEGMDLAAEIGAEDYCEISAVSQDPEGVLDFEKTIGCAAMNVADESKCVIM